MPDSPLAYGDRGKGNDRAQFTMEKLRVKKLIDRRQVEKRLVR
jgi:hypothetical protein